MGKRQGLNTPVHTVTVVGSGSVGTVGWELASWGQSAAEPLQGLLVGPTVKAKALARPNVQASPPLPPTTWLCPSGTSLSLLSLARHGPQGLVSALLSCGQTQRPQGRLPLGLLPFPGPTLLVPSKITTPQLPRRPFPLRHCLARSPRGREGLVCAPSKRV